MNNTNAQRVSGSPFGTDWADDDWLPTKVGGYWFGRVHTLKPGTYKILIFTRSNAADSGVGPRGGIICRTPEPGTNKNMYEWVFYTPIHGEEYPIPKEIQNPTAAREYVAAMLSLMHVN